MGWAVERKRLVLFSLFWFSGALAKGQNQYRFRERTANNLTLEPDQLRSGTVVEEHQKADEKQRQDRPYGNNRIVLCFNNRPEGQDRMMNGWMGRRVELSRVNVDQMPQPRYSVEGVWEWWW